MTAAGVSQLIGRAEPRERLRQVFSASAQGRRSAVLVSGEAGMGKTSLIRATIDAAAGDAAAGDASAGGSVVVGWGTCWHGEGAPGFWPWMQAFDDLARDIGQEAALAAGGEDRDLLAPLIRDFGPTRETPDDLDRQRFLLLDAAVGWLESLATQRQVVIVLDDLQWADASTLDLLDHLVAAPVDARLLVIGAYRHDELDPERRARLASLGSRTDHVHLAGLTLDEVEELVATICEPDLARPLAGNLHRRTGGHPLFVRELARLAAAGAAGPLPTAVAGALSRRLDTLSPGSRRVLDAASVLGNRLLPDVLAAVTGEPVAAVIEHLDTAQEAGVIRPDPGEARWFTHDLYRETLYAALSSGERARLHGRVGDALETRNRRGARVPPGDLARHFARAMTSCAPEKAIRWAREAARDERRRAAFRESADHLRRARAAALDVGWAIDGDTLVEMLLDEADAEARSGQPDVARELLAEAAVAAPGPRQQADVALALQRLGAKFATPRGEIIAQLESALQAITGEDVARQARVTAALARELQHSVSQDRSRAGPLSEAALALARDSADDETLAACLLARHDALWGPGTGGPRSILGEEIAAVGHRLGDTDRLAEGLLLQANGLLESGAPGFRPVLDRWFGLLEERNEPRDRYLVLTRRAALALLDGDSDRAEALMYDAAALGDRIHEPDTGNVLMSQRVALARLRNEPAEFAALADDAVRWWTGAPVVAHAVAAGARAAAGDLEGAARDVAMLSEAGGWRIEDSYLRSVLVADLAVAVAALHDHTLGTALLDDLLPLADSCGVNGAVVAFAGPFAHAAGLLAAELGDHDLARTMLDRSVETSRRLGARGWVRDGETALRSLTDSRSPAAARTTPGSGPVPASMTRTGNIWTVTFGPERGSLPHVKGLADIATLVRHPGQDLPALQLVGGPAAVSGGPEGLIDVEALRAYRQRLAELQVEIDQATDDADLASVDRLVEERDQVLAEVRRTTGLGGRIRTVASDPAERARKAVSARIRDALGSLDQVAPRLAAHLDRSIKTGLRCTYLPPADVVVRWRVDV